MHTFVAIKFVKYIMINMKEKKHLKEKRIELIWALSLQDYTDSEIASIFNVNRSTILRIVAKKPKNYKPKWIKN